jgi:hypothetical protein
MKDTPYAVVVSLTEGRKVIAVAGFDKPQAEAALEIIEMPPQARREHAQTLLAALSQVKRGQLILATPVTPSRLVRGTPVALPKRAAQLIAMACLQSNEAGVELLKQDLLRIAAGLLEPDRIRHPFLVSEGILPKR